jgi:hypothetical protein
MSIGKFLVVAILSVIGVMLAIKIIGALLGWALHAAFNIIIPLALVVGIVYVVYRLTEKTALGGDNRGILP